MDKDLDKRHLFKLSELEDYKVADNDPDVRGWALVDRDQDTIGTINELIVDPDQKKVRYLDVVAAAELSKEGGERHLIIPIGAAEVDEHEDKVIMRALDKELLLSFPDYKGGAITRDYELGVAEKLRGKRTTDTGDIYNNEYYNENTFYNPRRSLPVINSERQTSAYKAPGSKKE